MSGSAESTISITGASSPAGRSITGGANITDWEELSSVSGVEIAWEETTDMAEAEDDEFHIPGKTACIPVVGFWPFSLPTVPADPVCFAR